MTNKSMETTQLESENLIDKDFTDKKIRPDILPAYLRMVDRAKAALADPAQLDKSKFSFMEHAMSDGGKITCLLYVDRSGRYREQFEYYKYMYFDTSKELGSLSNA